MLMAGSVLRNPLRAGAMAWHGDSMITADFFRQEDPGMGSEYRGSARRKLRADSRFSSGFHREVLASTVSAQGGNLFVLRDATRCGRVGSPTTLDLLSEAER